MEKAESDPRVYFAAERTLLAWLRTGISIMAFGFVVARFGLFLRLLHAQGEQGASHGLSPYVGALLILLGVFATGGGAMQFSRFYKTLNSSEKPATANPLFPVAICWTVVAIGGALGIILVV